MNLKEKKGSQKYYRKSTTNKTKGRSWDKKKKYLNVWVENTTNLI